jgi:hypothetical protein
MDKRIATAQKTTLEGAESIKQLAVQVTVSPQYGRMAVIAARGLHRNGQISDKLLRGFEQYIMLR